MDVYLLLRGRIADIYLIYSRWRLAAILNYSFHKICIFHNINVKLGIYLLIKVLDDS